MTEPLGFISQSTENLFKFLFINGLILIGVGMFYPLQMSNDIDLKIVDYNKKVSLLNHEISALAKDIDNLDKVVQSRIVVSKDLIKKRESTTSISEKVEITDNINKMKLETNTAFQQIKKNEAERDKNVIRVEGDLKLISHLESQKKVYDRYCIVFLILGGILGLIGFVGWVIATYYTVDKDYHDYKERKQNRRNVTSAQPVIPLTPTDTSTDTSPTPNPPPPNSGAN